MVNVTSPKDCCGCTACASICPHCAITMEANSKGFLIPTIDERKCTQCGACENVCPLKANHDKDTNCVRASFALRLKDREILYKSSSGGAFYSLVNYTLSKGGVVFGAAYDRDLVVRHTWATTKEECKRFQGSKYSQSDLSNVFITVKRFLKDGKVVLFSGTPCQNHGLLKFLKCKYENLITVDIICHSVPSPLFFKEYLNMIENHFKDKIINISMRDKALGWGSTKSYRYYMNSGKEYFNPKGIVGWQRIFESGLVTRESCFDCHYTNLNRVTDFTIGDFWDTQNLRPELKSKEGTSILLVNTEKGLSILDAIKQQAMLWPVSIEEYMQPRLNSRTEEPINYNQFWSIYRKKGFNQTYKKYWKRKNIIIRILSRVNNFLK